MKPIVRFLSLCSALLLVATTGCLDLDLQILSFDNPSVAPEEAKVQTELFGTYIVTEPIELEEKASSSNTWFAHVGRCFQAIKGDHEIHESCIRFSCIWCISWLQITPRPSEVRTTPRLRHFESASFAEHQSAERLCGCPQLFEQLKFVFSGNQN